MSKPILKIGDEVIVYGQRFILDGFYSEVNKPPRLVFKSPVEYLEVSNVKRQIVMCACGKPFDLHFDSRDEDAARHPGAVFSHPPRRAND